MKVSMPDAALAAPRPAFPSTAHAARHERRQYRQTERQYQFGQHEAPRSAHVSFVRDGLSRCGLEISPRPDAKCRDNRNQANDNEQADLRPEKRVAEVEGRAT